MCVESGHGFKCNVRSSSTLQGFQKQQRMYQPTIPCLYLHLGIISFFRFQSLACLKAIKSERFAKGHLLHRKKTALPKLQSDDSGEMPNLLTVAKWNARGSCFFHTFYSLAPFLPKCLKIQIIDSLFLPTDDRPEKSVTTKKNPRESCFYSGDVVILMSECIRPCITSLLLSS